MVLRNPYSSRDRNGTKDVLIVEDEQSSRRALSLLLCSCGFRPKTFRTAEEALMWLSAGEHPAIALVDLDLPGIDGIELIEKLAQFSPMTRRAPQDSATTRRKGFGFREHRAGPVDSCA